MPPKLTKEFISAAIDGFEAQKARIDEKISELRGMLGSANSETSPTEESPRKRRTMSAGARKRIAAAQRQRWAALRQDTGPEPAARAPQKTKRRLSPEGRRRIIEATKKRWALARAAAKKSGAQAKKAAPKRAAAKTAAKKSAPKRAPAKVAAVPAKAAE